MAPALAQEAPALPTPAFLMQFSGSPHFCCTLPARYLPGHWNCQQPLPLHDGGSARPCPGSQNWEGSAPCHPAGQLPEASVPEVTHRLREAGSDLGPRGTSCPAGKGLDVQERDDSPSSPAGKQAPPDPQCIRVSTMERETDKGVGGEQGGREGHRRQERWETQVR